MDAKDATDAKGAKDAKDAKDSKGTTADPTTGQTDYKDAKDAKNTTSAATAARIVAAAAERNRLVQQVAATQHAKATLGQLAPQIADLTNKGYDASQLVATLMVQLRDQRATLDKHQKRAGSSVSKLFHRSDPKALAAEEDAYYEAEAWAAKAKVKLSRIDADLDALKQQRADLRARHDEHTAALNALDELYAGVFDGPSPDVGEGDEDALEGAVQAAQAVYDAIQARMTFALAVAGHLNAARGNVVAALNHIADALKYSRQDITDYRYVHYGSAASAAAVVNGPYYASLQADRLERDRLKHVPEFLAEAEHHLALAKQMDPAHLSQFLLLPQVKVAGQGHSVANLLDQAVNSPLTDYLFHMEIKDTQEDVRACLDVLDPEVEQAEARVEAIRQEREPAEAALLDGRRQLLDLRVELFEKVLRARDGEKEVEPPAYVGKT
ncbi:uncharacterized protein SPSK_01750 [Sporothrix schenckii 1099-18]|uniref:Uncharacterized protein n=2 Tax=Sporothrix schenckii TaxID=29908 RepID=U7PLQ5_SPOS1|nr:uncharacterized protein SPSK_01750 [Sporothrix schenckii 1099-18]ERS96492.1 hypothetical protein HMPREF1624_07407 [Sporothrix schenckii ATCC 58251]KJR87233.1 hypothetical protein SPSK_01750 [Sporothrix schenckii 1099-18]